jgi:hypothetical protein
MIFTIEKNIPIPERRNREKTPYRDTMELMSVGDSVLVPCAEKDYKTIQTRVASCYYKMRPKTFTSRKVSDGLRLWRVR